MSDSLPDLASAQKRALEIAAKISASGIANGSADDSRKRPLEDADGPDTKKVPGDNMTPEQIAQAAIAKLAGQYGFSQSMTIEIKVPNRLVGLVIGRQGEMINKLQAESGARIQVAPDGSEINGERQVSISGTPDTVEKAKVLVCKVVEDSGGSVTGIPVGIQSMSYNKMNLEAGQEVVEMMIPANKIGLIIGKGGEMIKVLQEKAGCKMQMIQDGPFASAPEKPLRMTGFPNNCKKARELVIELIEHKELERSNQGVRPRIDLPNPGGGNVTTLPFSVPANKVGLIIGKGGDTIRQLMVQSGCHIELDRGPDTNPNEKTFNIRGTPQQIQYAQELIKQKWEGGTPAYPSNPYMGHGTYAGQVQSGWGNYPSYGASGTTGYPGYGGNQQTQQPQADHAQAWANYYQQLYAAQGGQQGQAPQQQAQQPHPQQGQPGQAQQPGAQGQQSADLQAQWAEYYRQLQAYYNQTGAAAAAQQQQQQPPQQQHLQQQPPPGAVPPEQK